MPGLTNNTPFMNILLTLLLAGLTMVGPLAIDTYPVSYTHLTLPTKA